jgi:protein SCO1/2
MHRAGLTPRLLLSLLVLVAFAGGAVLVSGCGSSGSSKQKTATSAASKAKVDYKAEAVLTPATPEPPLKLRNYLGQPVNIDQYRGKPVLITFVYTHCPDVCPLMISNLRVAQNLMGANGASKAQVIAVSVDSKGDTRKTVTAFLKAHEMTGRMQYLIGSQKELARVWKAWGVGSERDAKDPDFVEHSGLVYGITASGKRAVLYSASFKPAAIVHDVPLLASN